MNKISKYNFIFKIVFQLFFIFVAVKFVELIDFQAVVIVLLVLIWSDIVFEGGQSRK